ncbi:MAG: hypothetical protein QW638_07215 [Candidatus Bathyarchaeia archaeon]|nr:hypothetical protein [Candidatus Bathyarchaeota archaeon]
MVRTVLDNFCIRSGILCERCEEKVKRGQITTLDLRVIRWLCDLEDEFPLIKDVYFHKAVETDDVLAILVEKQDMGKILSYGGRIIRSLREKAGKKVKVLSHGSDVREFLEELFSPFSILAINTIWLPDGSTETKVVLQGRRPRRMPVDLNAARKLAKTVRNLTLRVEFERR